VVTGDNGSGKTALLEALHIGTRGTPESVIQLNRIRGLPNPSDVPFPFQLAMGGITAASFRDIWLHLFRDENQHISIKYTDQNKRTWNLEIYFSTDEATSAPLLGQNERQGESVRPIIFDRRDNAGKTSKLTGSVNPQGHLAFRPAGPFGPPSFPFMSMTPPSTADAISWFSDLRMSGRSEEVVQFIREEFPFISNIEVLAPGGAQQGIYATLTSGGARSLSLISAGLQKLFSVVVALADAKKGIVLIDEIENGIFYEKYASTWATLYNLSKKTDSQLFVSSHSSECLEALLPTLNIDNNADDFCLLRTERENGKCSVRHISGASMKAALKRGGELRGAALDQKTQAHN
jgi:hypothetical protein